MNLVKNRRRIAVLVLLLILGCAGLLMARAGGGGGDSGGGDGDGIGALIWLILRLLIDLPFPANVISVAIVILVAVLIARAKKRQSILNKLPSAPQQGKVPGLKDFQEANPGFAEAAFKEKVKTAFLAIQDAWQAQDVGKARRFLSDGVYQRFHTQFRMMALLKQKNTIDNLQVRNIVLDRFDRDGAYDIAHVAIHASITDRFISELDTRLNAGGHEEFVEYWSFLRKRGVAEKDIYNSLACPNCGGELPAEMGEVSKCGYCGSLVNSGEFDWVLSKITQADDYIGTNPKVTKTATLNLKLRRLVEESEDFSVQLVEDKASNGYLQVIAALAVQDATIMRRFVSDAAFEKLQARMQTDRFVYNRIYLNDVTLIGVREEGKRHQLLVSVRASWQRVALADGRVDILDPVVVTRNEVVVLARDRKTGTAKGSLYMHNCPSCGAAVENTLDIRCAYCESPLNSTKHEWIVDDILSLSAYREFMQEHRGDFSYTVDQGLLEKAYDVRDFAINNLLVVIAADGVFEESELAFARETAKHWGFDPGRLEQLFTMARGGRLSIRMPAELKARKKVYRMMEKAAEADGRVSDEERTLLDTVHKEYLEAPPEADETAEKVS